MSQYLECHEGTSNKFYRISIASTSVVSRYGKCGTAGAETSKDFANLADARKFFDKMVAEKLKKGYVSMADPSGAGVPPAAAATTGKRAATSAPPPPAAPVATKKARGGAGGVSGGAAAPGSSPVAPDAALLRTLSQPEAGGVAPISATSAAAPAPTAAATLAAGADSLSVYLECHEGTSNKFYRISLGGTLVVSVYGACGTAGTRLEKTFATPGEARKFFDKTLAEKRKKGYTDGASEGSEPEELGGDSDESTAREMSQTLGDCKEAPVSRFHTLAKGVRIQPMLTLAEMRLIAFEAAIRAKPDWARKALDARITAAWRADFLAAASGAAANADAALMRGTGRPAEADWVLSRVAWLARGCDGAIAAPALPSVVRGAIEARGLVTAGQLTALIAAAAPLEAAEPRDYHPGSGRRVVNLVHPSLWPVVYGFTALRGGSTAQAPAHIRPVSREDIDAIRTTLGLPASLPVTPAAHEAAWASRADFDRSLAALTEAYRATGGSIADTLSFVMGGDPKAKGMLALRAFEARFRPAPDLAPPPRLKAAGAAPAGVMADEDGDDLLEEGAGDESGSMLGSYDGVDDATRRGLWSSRYQWLPADVAVDEAGACRFVSYINNVDPTVHGPLYSALGAVLSRFLPLFERVLAEAVSPERPQLPRPYADEDSIQEKWMDREKSKRRGKGKKKKASGDDDDDDELEEELWEKWRDARNSLPAPAVRVPPWAPRPAPPQVSLRNRRLQVIVKLASIELTPDRPTYNGGTWHLEGAANEFIVATGIYYYAQENIGRSSLHFRVGVAEPSYSQGADWLVGALYGVDDGAALVQSRGHVETDAGLCLVWPNTLQHRVAPFALADPTRPGHRKILVFFLVDPDAPITSSRDVPQQQPSAIARALRGALPPDLAARVAEFATFSREQALAHRLALMAQRKFTERAGNKIVRREFSLCEH